uniref:Uncharacterized protein n=1 Tax=Octopus bimaculoides TaxID=37653 RepID=A0A0L8GQI1_OCTBM
MGIEFLGSFDIVGTSGGDVVFVKWEGKRWWRGFDCCVCWYREHLVKKIKLSAHLYYFKYRPHLTAHGEYVYITDRYNNIYQIPRYDEHRKPGDIEPYLLLSGDDKEVYKVLGFDVRQFFRGFWNYPNLLLSFIMGDK